MGLFSTPEFISLSIDASCEVRGVRLRRRNRREIVVVRAVVAAGNDLETNLSRSFEALGSTRGCWLLLGVTPDGGGCFQIKMPELAPRELASALRFEAERELLRLPDDSKLQFVSHSCSETETQVTCAVFPGEQIMTLALALTNLRKKPDALLHPLLALPPLPPGSRVAPPELGGDFFWCDGGFHATDGLEPGATVNAELIAELKRDCRIAPGVATTAATAATPTDETRFWKEFLSPVMLGRFGMNTLLGNSALGEGVAILPERLRPARCRAQLRLAAILLMTLIALLGVRFWGSGNGLRTEYRQVSSELAARNEQIDKLKAKLKAGEKESKELKRMAELKLGDRDLPMRLSVFAEKLPDTVLVTNLRWSENSVELILQTEAADLDMITMLGRLPGFKIASANQRLLPNGTLTLGNIKLNRTEE